jgi:hypothetical protein
VARVAVRRLAAFAGKVASLSGLGMSAGKVQDAGSSRLHRGGAALGSARAAVSGSAHGHGLVGSLRRAGSGAGHLAGPLYAGSARGGCFGRDRLGGARCWTAQCRPRGSGGAISSTSTLPSRS